MSDLELIKREESQMSKAVRLLLFAGQGALTIASAFGLGLAAVYIIAAAALTLSFLGNAIAFLLVFAAFVWMVLQPSLHGKVSQRVTPDPITDADEITPKYLS